MRKFKTQLPNLQLYRMLGIIGGMGPQAGISLYQQVLAQTAAQKDQDHVPTILWSTPDRIPDRTAFLMGKEPTNPADPVADIVSQMAGLGVCVVGIPCNTFHAPPIWDKFVYNLLVQRTEVKVVHLVEATVQAIQTQMGLSSIGLLSTLGTYKSRVYTNLLATRGITTIEPSDQDRVRLHDAIYNERYGIKALNHIGHQAAKIIMDVADRMDAETMLLGCTELCLDWENGHNLLENRFETVNPLAVMAAAMLQPDFEGAAWGSGWRKDEIMT